jgi:predicted Zn-dependent protease
MNKQEALAEIERLKQVAMAHVGKQPDKYQPHHPLAGEAIAHMRRVYDQFKHDPDVTAAFVEARKVALPRTSRPMPPYNPQG